MASIALGISALASAGLGAFGADQQSNASKDAAYTQSQAANATIPLTNAATDKATSGLTDAKGNAISWTEGGITAANASLAPFGAPGGGTVANLNTELNSGGPAQFNPGSQFTTPNQFSFSPSDLQNTPGYQFSLDQGLKAIDAGAASRGMAASGGTIKAEQAFGTGLADQTFGNAFQRALSTFGANQGSTNDAFTRALSTFQANQSTTQQQIANQFNLANLGYNVATQQGQNQIGQTQWAGNTALSTAAQVGNWGLQGAGLNNAALTGAANATAAGTVGSANAWANGLSNIGASATNAADMYTLSQLFKKAG